MPLPTLPYRSKAARALVLLHEQHLRIFLDTWERAIAANVVLPSTEDPASFPLPKARWPSIP